VTGAGGGGGGGSSKVGAGGATGAENPENEMTPFLGVISSAGVVVVVVAVAVAVAVAVGFDVKERRIFWRGEEVYVPLRLGIIVLRLQC
jgi:hypothetical protein